MLRVSVRQVNASALSQLEPKIRRRVERGVVRALKASAREWQKLVISSTWFDKRPAPTDSVIALVSPPARRGRTSVISYRYGWLDYRGSPARAAWRLSLREWMHTPKVFERLNKALGRGNG